MPWELGVVVVQMLAVVEVVEEHEMVVVELQQLVVVEVLLSLAQELLVPQLLELQLLSMELPHQ